MGQRARRRYCTAAESAEIWDRWQRGEGLKSIGRVFGKSSGSIFSHLMPFGGIRPRPRRRSRLALTLVEREQISRGLVNGDSLRLIAIRLARAASTVSREVTRNGGLVQYLSLIHIFCAGVCLSRRHGQAARNAASPGTAVGRARRVSRNRR